MYTTPKIVRNANESAIDTYRGVHWVLMELVSRYARVRVAIALTFLMLSIGCLTGIPFTLQFVFDAFVAGDKALALTYVWYTALASIGGAVFGTLHDHFREKAWNRNYFTINVRLVKKLFDRTYDEVLGEDSEIGAEQVESTKDRAQNILYLLFFETPVVIATIITATLFIFLIDSSGGFGLVLLTLFNLIWFYFFNTKIDEKMAPIDKAFRRSNRRLVEKLNLVASVKAAGVERKTVQEIGTELSHPLGEDLKIWAYWFQIIDFGRRLVNAVAPILMLMYSITYTDMSLGELTAVSTWSFMIAREYGFIGHLMRHLTSQVSRIKAARITLSQPPAFDFEAGIIYERKS